MMDRRTFLCWLTLEALATQLAAQAQERGRIPKIGVLWHAANAEEEGPLFKGVVAGFRALGYVEGRTISLEHRFPNEIPERFKRMATELVASNVDALVGAGSKAALPLREATKTFPIVSLFSPAPVGTKLGESLSRRGGNVTVLSNFSSVLIGNPLHLEKKAIPRLSRVALL